MKRAVIRSAGEPSGAAGGAPSFGKSRLAGWPAQATSAIEVVAVFAAFLGIVVALQILAGAYASGFGGYPDEPAHLVTSLMVRDFLAGLDLHRLLHPLQFARDYYYHYPKVAIGHWPPLFYAAVGLWFLVVGASRSASLLFIALVAATTASLTYFTGKRLIGVWAGLFAALVFVACPLTQQASARLMTEHASTLAMLASALCFARFARSGRSGDGLLFGTVAAAAILTHPNAWALALLPPFAIAFSGRWRLLRRPGLWLSILPVLMLAVPWYALTLGMIENGVGAGSPFWIEGSEFAGFIYGALGVAVLLFAAIGVWVRIVRARRAEIAPEWAALAGLAAATFVLHSAIPTGAAGRYMMPVIPPLVLFAAAGIAAVARRCGKRLPAGVAQAALAAVVLAAFGGESFALPLQLRNAGYDALVKAVTARVAHVPQIWLVSSGATGEGCLVAAVALHEKRPGSYVLRGKTILAGGNWLWNDTRDRFDTPAKLARLLARIPVTVVVIDDVIPRVDRRPYQARLAKLLADEPDRWKLIGSYPQIQHGKFYPDSLHVYARRPVASLAAAPPAIHLDRLKALMVLNVLR